MVTSLKIVDRLIGGEKSTMRLHNALKVLAMLQTLVLKFFSWCAPCCQLPQCFHLLHLATAHSPCLSAKNFLLWPQLVPFLLLVLYLFQVRHKAVIYLFHLGLILFLDLLH